MKKNLVVIAFIVTALCSLCLFSVSATEAEGVHISSTEFQVRQGNEFTTTIYIADDANILDFNVQLKYDTDKLTLISASENEDSKGAVQINAATAGAIIINYTGTFDNVTKKTMLVDLTFRVDEYLPAGVYDCLTVDPNGAYVAHGLVNGLLEEVDFNCEFAPLNIYETGDVDLNYKVDIGDATYIRRYLAQLHTLTEFQLYFADTQHDGTVDIADAVALQRKLAQLEVDGYGERINVMFCSTGGEVLTQKSVKIGSDLNVVPEVPLLSGHTNGRWSLSKTEYVEPDYTHLTSDMTVYAVYDRSTSPYMQYYISLITSEVDQYNGVITSNWELPTVIVYPENTAYTSKIVWTSSDANVFSNNGAFSWQYYDKTITLTAAVYSYLDSPTPESSATLTFTLLAKGAYPTPTKAEIVKYLQTITNGTLSGTGTIVGGEIDCDLHLIRKVSNRQVDSASGSIYEVRLEWVVNENGVYKPISQIHRNTSAQTVDLVATITFNGEPLEDGKVYFDDVSLTAITEDEIRRYVVGQIASKVQNSFSNGDALWDDETVYNCEIKWVSKDVNTITIEQNVVTVNEQTVNGVTCPVIAQVTYPTESGSNTFVLEYVVTVENPANKLLSPGANISESLYYALMIEMRDRFGYTQLTTEALKNTKFVSLDLSKYSDWFEDGAGEKHPPITDLTGLTYCENLRLLNISGLNITSGVSEISGLTYLESLIANNVNISSEAIGGRPILSNMINIKLVDLSQNDLTTLDTFFSSDVVYGKLKELYLDNNNLSDISLLSQTPMLTLLTLSHNNLESDDISVLADKAYLTYLSLNNNRIDGISSLSNLTELTELRLQCNSISDISALKNMTAMTKLYLGDNRVIHLDSLANLTHMEVLYLNNNVGITDISPLREMTEMQILHISNCSVNQIVHLQQMLCLRELYAENNEITGFSVLSKFVLMEKLLLAGNERSGQVLEWNKYLGNMANLKVLTLSGLDVYDLSFLETESTDSSTQMTSTTVKPIERLEIANCAITSTYSNGESSVNNMDKLKKLDLTLKYLDISNNPVDANITELGYLSSLELLYADNIDIGEDIVGLMAGSQSMKYLSLENCNISNMYNNSGKPWLGTSRKYVYIDLAQNPIGAFDFSFVENSVASLQHLYLDTVDASAVLELSVDYSDNILVVVSLEGYSIENVNLIPDMPHVRALNLKNTQLADFVGSVDANGDYPYSLARFDTLEYLDVSQSEMNIFTKTNLEMLYANYADIYVNLYADDGNYAVPEGYSKDGVLSAQKEAAKILSFINNMVDDVRVATEGISDNNPELILNIEGYEINWQVSDTDHYSVSSGKLTLSDITNIKNDTLIFTATLNSIYGVDSAASRLFDVQTEILRLSDAYITCDASGASGTLMRGNEFSYDYHVIAHETEQFSDDVTPVNYTIVYTYSAVNGDGTEIDASQILEIVSDSTHQYKLKSDAPLGAHVTITVTIACADDAANDVTRQLTVKVVPQTYTLTFVPNGGTVKNANGDTITKLIQEEESELVYSQTRIGHTFDDWYIDPQFATKFTSDIMPSENVTIYAKWNANTYTVAFDANGGSVSLASKTVVYDDAYGELPSPTRTGHKVSGWMLNGSTVTKESKVATASDHTLVAKWEAITYTVQFNLNASSILTTPQCSKTTQNVTFGSNGPLAVPQAPHYAFDGWYTASVGGTRITDASGKYTGWNVPNNITLYAHWKKASGYEDYTYLNSSNFATIKDNPSGKYLLVQDVNLSNFTYIDTFTGVLDGGDHTLSGWNYVQSSVGSIGLIKLNKGTITNLYLDQFKITTSDPNVSGQLSVGLLCGTNAGTISDVHVTNGHIDVDVGSVSTNADCSVYAGGICGVNGKEITNCSVANTTINAYAGTQYCTAKATVGGVIGYTYAGTSYGTCVVKNVTSSNNKLTCTAKANYNKNWLGKCKEHGYVAACAAGIIGQSGLDYEYKVAITDAMSVNNTIDATVSRGCGCDSDTRCSESNKFNAP